MRVRRQRGKARVEFWSYFLILVVVGEELLGVLPLLSESKARCGRRVTSMSSPGTFQ